MIKGTHNLLAAAATKPYFDSRRNKVDDALNLKLKLQDLEDQLPHIDPDSPSFCNELFFKTLRSMVTWQTKLHKLTGEAFNACGPWLPHGCCLRLTKRFVSTTNAPHTAPRSN